MGRIQLVYHSESGFTERCAEWLAEDLDVNCVRFDKSMSVEAREPGDVLVIGAPVHGGKMARSRDIERLVGRAGRARAVCFATGAAEPADGLAERLARASFRNPERIAMRYLPGGFDEERLGQGSRALIKALRLMLAHRRDLTAEQQLLLERTAARADFTSRELVRELAGEIRGMSA